MIRPARIVAGLTVAAAALAASTLCAAPADAESSGGVEIPSFYNPPSSVPSTPGTLMKSESMPLATDLPVVFPGKSTRLMYSSVDSSGKPVAVTGAYIEPTKKWSGSGPRPVVAFAVGTIGQGDQCAPSFNLEHPLLANVSSSGSSFNLNYDMVQMSLLLNQGIAVAVTDYVGLGTTDRVHTYVNRVDSGHAVLDVARAALQLKGTDITSSSAVGIEGYSQGGGAAASAAELQPSYAPELNLKGTYAGAPPADLAATLKGIDGNIIAGVAGYAVNGFMQSYPQLQSIVSTQLNSAGTAALKKLSTQCIPDSVLSYGFAKTSSWTKSGKSLSEIIAASPELTSVVDQQRIGRLKPTSPVLVTTDLGDGTVPHSQVRQLARDWCARGTNVTYRTYGLPNVAGDKAAIHHLAGAVESAPGALTWMKDRLSGKSVTSNCSSMSWLP